MILTDEQEYILEQLLETERKLLYQGWIDTRDICLPSLKVKCRRKGTVVSMDLIEWERYTGAVKELLQVLEYAREQLEKSDDTEQTISFDEYIKKEVLDYDAEDFEKVLDRFEEVYPTDEEIEL